MAAMKHLLMEVEDLWTKGHTMFEIAEILNVDEDLVEDCLDAMDAMEDPRAEALE